MNNTFKKFVRAQRQETIYIPTETDFCTGSHIQIHIAENI